MGSEAPGVGPDEVTDVQRSAAIDALRAAAGDGHIDLEEFGDRAGVVYGAGRVDEIRAVLADLGAADLPVLAPSPDVSGLAPPPVPPPPRESQTVVAVMSGADRKGAWNVKGQVNAVAVMGGIDLDFRHAELSAEVTQVNAVVIMGGIDIVVPEGVPVEVDGFVLMGGVDDKTRRAPAPGRPMLRVSAFGMMGGVTVRHPRRRGKDRGAPTEVPPVRSPREIGRAEPDGATVTLLSTHVVDSIAKAETLGDHRWFDVLQSHHGVLRDQIVAQGGRLVRSRSDGCMASFTSARQAVLCAIAIQRGLVVDRLAHPEADLHVRIGVHSGEVIDAGDDLFGRNVDAVDSIAAAAAADEILVSAVTKQLADARGDLRFGEGRAAELVGFTAEWRLHAVRWSGDQGPAGSGR